MASSYRGSILLKIIFRYEGLKATQYFSKFTSVSDAVFREDVLALKLPHPSRENTTFISYGCVECVWPLVPKNGALHRQVLGKTEPQDPEGRKALDILLRKLSISSLVVKDFPRNTAKGRKDLKRPNPFNSEGREEGSLPNLPHNVAPKVAEAEAFLHDMSDSFRPHKMLKTEAVDAPQAPRRSVRILRQLHRPPSSPSSHLPSTSMATNPPESPSSSSSLGGKVSPSHANHGSLLGLPITTPTKMIMPTSDQPALIDEILHKLQSLRSTPQSLPEPVQCQLSVPDADVTPIPAPQISFGVTTNYNSRPDWLDQQKIQRLTIESYDIRRQINADSLRDVSIISELKQLNAQNIPGPLRILDSAMEGRIRKLEQDLETEKMLRLEAEAVVRDIQREYKAPFVVPGLLDAFIKLSRLTTQATHMKQLILSSM